MVTSASMVHADLVGGLAGRNRRQLLMPLNKKLLLPLNLHGFFFGASAKAAGFPRVSCMLLYRDSGKQQSTCHAGDA